MQEHINRADAPDQPAARPADHARDNLRQRLERLADGHPSSDRYRESDLSQRDDRADTARTDTSREDAGLSRRDDRADTARTDTNREDATGADTSREETTATRRGDGSDTTERKGSGWAAPAVRDHADKPAEDDIHLTPDRERHILDGDGEAKPGGGHRHGTNKPGKTEFPERWPDDVITRNVEEVARRPDSVHPQRGGSWLVSGGRDGVQVNTVVLADGRIWTAWPEPGGAGVRQNPKGGAA